MDIQIQNADIRYNIFMENKYEQDSSFFYYSRQFGYEITFVRI